MSSKRKIDSARANGAKSHGPVTEEGRKISSLNALTHGLNASTVVLPNENQDEYDFLLESYAARVQPADLVEMDLVGRNVQGSATALVVSSEVLVPMRLVANGERSMAAAPLQSRRNRPVRATNGKTKTRDRGSLQFVPRICRTRLRLSEAVGIRIYGDVEPRGIVPRSRLLPRSP